MSKSTNVIFASLKFRQGTNTTCANQSSRHTQTETHRNGQSHSYRRNFADLPKKLQRRCNFIRRADKLLCVINSLIYFIFSTELKKTNLLSCARCRCACAVDVHTICAKRVYSWMCVRFSAAVVDLYSCMYINNGRVTFRDRSPPFRIDFVDSDSPRNSSDLPPLEPHRQRPGSSPPGGHERRPPSRPISAVIRAISTAPAYPGDSLYRRLYTELGFDDRPDWNTVYLWSCSSTCPYI